jgi:hypothetical protein
MLNLTLQQSELRIGDHLTGYVQWTGNQPAKEIKLIIQWRTEGRGSIDEAKLHAMILPPEGGHFSFQIPSTAPYSYDGQLIRIIWEVKSIAKIAGLVQLLKTVTQPFYVNPY